jgi:hypothetical protein
MVGADSLPLYIWPPTNANPSVGLLKKEQAVVKQISNIPNWEILKNRISAGVMATAEPFSV